MATGNSIINHRKNDAFGSDFLKITLWKNYFKVKNFKLAMHMTKFKVYGNLTNISLTEILPICVFNVVLK